MACYWSHKNLKFGGGDGGTRLLTKSFIPRNEKSKWKSIYNFLTFYDIELALSPKRRQWVGENKSVSYQVCRRWAIMQLFFPLDSQPLRTHTRNQKEFKILTLLKVKSEWRTWLRPKAKMEHLTFSPDSACLTPSVIAEEL